MGDKVEKMTANECILLMLRCFVENKNEDIFPVIERYIDAQKQANRYTIVTQLQYYLKEKYRQPQIKTLKELSSEIKPFITCYEYPKKKLFLEKEVQEVYNQLLLEWKYKSLFTENKLPTRNKILLYGPTGNGKTTFARTFAQEIGLPMYEIRQDALIDSHLGKTAKNIAQVFTGIKDDCVMFLDEIDSVSLKRGSTHDIPEIDRAQNALLIHLERLPSNIIFIGATNRLEKMDNAFIRRFDCKYEIPLPSTEQRINFINNFKNKYSLDITIDQYKDLNSLNSYSDLENKLLSYAREKVFSIIKEKEEVKELA